MGALKGPVAGSSASLILDFLKDNQWHQFNEILAAVCKDLTSERATQIYINSVDKSARDKAIKKPLDQQIEQGRKQYISEALRRLVLVKTLEYQPDKELFNRKYRLIPPEKRPKQEKKVKPPKGAKKQKMLQIVVDMQHSIKEHDRRLSEVRRYLEE